MKDSYVIYIIQRRSEYIFSLLCMLYRSLFHLLYFFFWPLCCLYFFDLRILITPFVSSNSGLDPNTQPLLIVPIGSSIQDDKYNEHINLIQQYPATSYGRHFVIIIELHKFAISLHKWIQNSFSQVQIQTNIQENWSS